MSDYDQHSLDRLEPAYLASYGLREAPFSEVHDDRFLYLEPERAQRLNMLQHMVQYSDLLLMMTGERGSGKSALLQRLLQSLSEQWQVCQVYANTMMDAEQLLFQIARGFAVENLPQTSSQLQEQLYQRLASLHERDKVPLLIVDDAHELPQDALEMLFQLADVETSGGKLVRIILFCEPQIETMLDSPSIASLRDRITHRLEMPVLNESETAEYIKHRMAVSGFDGTSPFTPKMIKKIFKASHGLPAKINVLAHESLEEGDIAIVENDEDSLEPQERRITPLHMLLGGVVVIVVALVLVFQDDINRLFEGQVDHELLEANMPKAEPELMAEAEPIIEPTTPVTEPKAVKPLKEKLIALKPDAMALDALEEVPVNEQENDQAVFAGTTESSATETAAKTTNTGPAEQAPDLLATPVVATSTLEISGVEPQPIIGSHKRQTVSILGNGFNKDSKVRLEWSGNKKVLSRAQVILEDPSRLNLLITTGIKADDWKVVVLNGKQASNTYTFNVLPPPRNTHSVTDGQKWINRQPADHFTLQLLSVYQFNAIEKYIRQHNLDGDDIAIIRTFAKGQHRYVLTKGVYASRDAAQAGVQTLPSAVQKAKPWIRAFKDLRSQIKTAKTTAAKSTTTVAAPRSAISLLQTSKVPTGVADQTAWLWSQDPRHFTLQLFGTYQADSARHFIQQHKLSGKAVMFKTLREGRDWYVLVYGSYTDRSKAKQAIRGLPKSLASSSPWVRSFASVHEVLHGPGQ